MRLFRDEFVSAHPVGTEAVVMSVELIDLSPAVREVSPLRRGSKQLAACEGVGVVPRIAGPIGYECGCELKLALHPLGYAFDFDIRLRTIGIRRAAGAVEGKPEGDQVADEAARGLQS